MNLHIAAINCRVATPIQDEIFRLAGKNGFVLESFAYWRDEQNIFFNPPYKLLVDSGAFTYMANTKKTVDFDEYTRRYADFLCQHDARYYFEMDVDSVIGLAKVEKLRQLLEDRTRKKSIPVWHLARGMDYFRQMCNDYDYVAIGGIAFNNKEARAVRKALPMLVNYANSKGVKVHALGYTPTSLESLRGLYSADSSSWLSGSRFATVYKFNGKKLITTKPPPGKRLKDYLTLDTYNLKEWTKYQSQLLRMGS